MIITPPFTEAQKRVIEATEKLANKKMLCDVDGVDDIAITNFDKVTASPEALAEFIENILDACSGDIDECDVCQLGKHCNPCDGFKKIALNWLNEEYKE